MKIAFDIGGVLSKYPRQFISLISTLSLDHHEIHVITDMHIRDEVLKVLDSNGFDFITKENIHCANYAEHGEFCKAIILKQLGIDMFIDDFVGYIQWDSKLGPAPIRLLVAPDGFKPYWSPEWKVAEDQDFGRRVMPVEKL